MEDVFLVCLLSSQRESVPCICLELQQTLGILHPHARWYLNSSSVSTVVLWGMPVCQLMSPWQITSALKTFHLFPMYCVCFITQTEKLIRNKVGSGCARDQKSLTLEISAISTVPVVHQHWHYCMQSGGDYFDVYSWNCVIELKYIPLNLDIKVLNLVII
jgi:hypothetical protein